LVVGFNVGFGVGAGVGVGVSETAAVSIERQNDNAEDAIFLRTCPYPSLNDALGLYWFLIEFIYI